MMLRAVPNIARDKRDSDAGLTLISLPSKTIFTALLKVSESLPFAPSIDTVLPSTDALHLLELLLEVYLFYSFSNLPYQTLQSISPPTF
jgi:hypothetical protein